MVDVVVAIPTFRRPNWLTRLLHELESLETTASISVLVADNDAERREGVAVCEGLSRAGYRWPLRAIVVPERGISQARNALFAEALALKGDDLFVAMLDDDEWPNRAWIESLLAVQRETGADIVQGPVVCEFAHSPPVWAELANVCIPPRQDSGTIAAADAGGNVLLSRACLARKNGEWFDPQFGLTGGEDKDFFVRMGRLGATSAWSASAVAYTSIPESRMSWQWALRRAFRSGNCDMRITLKYDRRTSTLAKESVKMLGGLVLSPIEFVACIGSAKHRARAVFAFARALGKAAAPLGREYREYEFTHGC